MAILRETSKAAALGVLMAVLPPSVQAHDFEYIDIFIDAGEHVVEAYEEAEEHRRERAEEAWERRQEAMEEARERREEYYEEHNEDYWDD